MSNLRDHLFFSGLAGGLQRFLDSDSDVALMG
jgi:hypothetical protein